MWKNNLSDPKKEQHLDKYYHDKEYKNAWDAKHAHQHIQSETPLSNGSHANETDIIDAKPSGGPGSNGYFLLWLCPLLFVGCILLTNFIFGL